MFKTTSFWSLLFVVALLGFNSLVFWSWHRTEAYDKPIVWSLGGPIGKSEIEQSSLRGDLVYPGGVASLENNTGLIVENSAIAGASDPLSNLISLGGGLKKYKVKRGDTITNLASRFNISAETIRWANPGVGSLKPGDTIIILPVSGVVYNPGSGDTLQAIASRYQADAGLIKTYNPDYQKILSERSGPLILPYAKPIVSQAKSVSAGANNLPDLRDYFALPAIGWNWGQLHNYNAVDIANQCGTSVHAAAEGLVVADENFGDGSSGWNDGYGVFVLLEHPNGTKTRYAHLDKALAKIGDYVNRGQEIGVMGSTGNTHGPTGCHLHFEVYGAKNPFAVSK